MVDLKRSEKQRELIAQLCGQVGGAGLSRATAIEVPSSDDTDTSDDDGDANIVVNTPVKSMSRANSADTEGAHDADEISAVKVNANAKSASTKLLILATSTSPPSSSDDIMDYIELSDPGPPPSDSETVADQEKDRVSSLCHAGTLRKRSQSPPQAGGDSKRARRKPTPDLSSVQSIVEHLRRVTPRNLTRAARH
jgi:hypothetical protein